MFRKIETALDAWRQQKGHLPLVVHGARQVGKTHSIKAFGGRCYEHVAYVSLEVDEYIVREIERDMRPQSIIKAISDYRGQPILPGRSLLVFDEIQNCERALTALKYFAEEMPELDIIAAGSLLGVAIARKKAAFPVGKVQLLQMHPMDFEEYLHALGKEQQANRIRDAWMNRTELPDFLHDELMRDFRDYLVYGGMPAVVKARIAGEGYERSMAIANGIVNQYLADMTKYCGAAESVKIRMAYDSIPAQLAKENTKFQYGVVRKGASASYFGSAIDWLRASGTILLCRRINHGYFPPASHMDLSAFKVYYADVGLLSARTRTTPESLYAQSGSSASSNFRGDLTENYVAGALQGNDHEIFYWESDGKAEIDFVIARDGAAIPIEVKAAEHVRSRSLSVYKGKYNPPYAIRLSGKNFGFSDGLYCLPLYAAFVI